MIWDFILSLPAFLLSALASILPTGGGIPIEYTQGVYTVWSDINAFSFIVPVQTLLTVLGLALAFHLAILTFKIVNWLITKIPFVG